MENTGGEGGGHTSGRNSLRLRRSELAILRKHASRFPIVEGERQEAVDCVLDVMRTSKSRRTKLAAVKTLAELDKVNLAELKVYFDAKRLAQQSELKPAVVNNTQINLHAAPAHDLNTLRDSIRAIRGDDLGTDSSARSDSGPDPV